MILNEVRKNKVKTFFIVTFFFILVVAFVYFLSLYLFDNDVYLSVAMALLFSSITTVISYYNSDKIVIKLNGGREATKEEYQELNLILEGLCLAAGLPKPKLYVMDTDALNAFATGRNPNHSAICVTSGLLKKMDKYELEGVLGHELAHIKNYDILLQTVVVVMVGFISILSDLFARGFIGRRSSRDNDDNKAGAIIMIIGLVFIILSPIFANLVKLAISRNREYLADARSVEFTRNSAGLISALEKIRDDNEPMTSYSKTTASLFISSPNLRDKERDSLLSTHPNINNRINRLRNIN